MGKEKESFIAYDKNITRRERRNRYDVYMKNKLVEMIAVWLVWNSKQPPIQY